MSAFVVCCSLLASAAPAAGTHMATFNEYAQQEPQGAGRQDTLRVYQLLGIVLTVPRTDITLRENPAATTVVDSTVLDATPRSIAADEALRLVPGVKVDNQANGSRVHMSIRGQGILSERGLRGIKVLLDGLPLNDPSGFAPDLFDVDWSNVDRIEVLRGPGASLYGGGSTAGVLNIITPLVGEESGAGAVGMPATELRYGSHNFWKAAGRVDGRPGNLAYRLSASRAEGDGYRDHTAFAATNLYARGEWAASQRLRLRPIVGWTDYFNENAEGLNLEWLAEDRRQANPDALIYNEFQRTRRLTGGFTGTYDLHQATALDFNAYVRNTEYKESVPSSVQHRTLTPVGATVQVNRRLETGGTDTSWGPAATSRCSGLASSGIRIWAGPRRGLSYSPTRPSGRAGWASSCSTGSSSAEPGAA